MPVKLKTAQADFFFFLKIFLCTTVNLMYRLQQKKGFTLFVLVHYSGHVVTPSCN